jgi:hypothetical protein
MRWVSFLSISVFISSSCLAETYGDFSYTTNELGATITGYNGTNSIVNIPSGVNDIAVTQIGEIWQGSVYPLPPIFGWYNTSVISVIIPDTVTSIGEGAFSYCNELTSVTIGKNVTKIRDYTFQQNPKLTNIIIPEGVAEIGLAAFHTCSELSAIRIPGSVTNLGSYTFINCTNLSRVEMLGNPPSYQTEPFANTTATIFFLSTASGWTNTFAGRPTELMDGINDDDNDGLSNYEERIVYGTNPTLKDSNSDGIEDGQAVAIGYNPLFNFAPLITFLQSNPPTGLYTTNQIHNLGLGGIMLSRNTNNQLTLNYQILQSTNLQNWTAYTNYVLPITNAPTNKLFLRVQAVGQ